MIFRCIWRMFIIWIHTNSNLCFYCGRAPIYFPGINVICDMLNRDQIPPPWQKWRIYTYTSMFLLLLCQSIWIWCVYLMVLYLLHVWILFVCAGLSQVSIARWMQGSVRCRSGQCHIIFLYICVLILYILHFVLYCTIYLSHTSPWLMLLVISCDKK